MEDQKIRKALAPAVWEELKKTLADHCSSIGKVSPVKLECKADGINTFKLANLGDRRQAILTYNPDVPCIFYKTPLDSGPLTFRVSADGTCVQLMAKGSPTETQEAAVVIISQITG